MPTIDRIRLASLLERERAAYVSEYRFASPAPSDGSSSAASSDDDLVGTEELR